MTLFDFETRHFEAEGIATTSVGNPALRRDVSAADPAGLRAAIGAGPDDPILLVLPGSRRSEIKYVFPAFEDAALRLAGANPALRLVVAAADTVAAQVKARVAGWPRRAHVVEGERDKLSAMRAATVALAKSGTVTTELAVAGCPMVVGYRGHPATALIARAIVRTRFLTLFNIAADCEIAPELLQEHCNGPELAAAVSALLSDPARRQAQAEAQTAALAKLGAGVADPFAAAADVVIELAGERGLLRA
jgi:lipid-A-disaccharide synthase